MRKINSRQIQYNVENFEEIHVLSACVRTCENLSSVVKLNIKTKQVFKPIISFLINAWRLSLIEGKGMHHVDKCKHHLNLKRYSFSYANYPQNMQMIYSKSSFNKKLFTSLHFHQQKIFLISLMQENTLRCGKYSKPSNENVRNITLFGTPVSL